MSQAKGGTEAVADDAALWDLQRRSERFFAHTTVAETIGKRKALVFVTNAASQASTFGIAEETTALAQQAIDIFRRGAVGVTPSGEQLEALQRCIRFMRPALLVRRDRLEISQDDRPRVPLGDAQRTALEQLLPGVAAIGLASEPLGLGTGFLVAPRVLCTNRHVVAALTASLPGTPALPAGLAVAHFGLEYRGDLTKPRISILGVLAYPMDPALDIAFLALAADGPLPQGLPLARTATLTAGQEVLVVGYPGEDARSPAWSRLVFDGRFGVKRASPGEIVGTAQGRCFHDSSTLGGNSGSPVIDCQSGCVVAVHSSGQFAYRNEAVLTSTVSACAEVADHVQNWRSL